MWQGLISTLDVWKAKPRVDGSLKKVEKIREKAYRLKLPNDYDISPTFDVKDLRPYLGENLRASFFYQLWGIDVEVSTTTIVNSILIMKNLDSGGCETL